MWDKLFYSIIFSVFFIIIGCAQQAVSIHPDGEDKLIGFENILLLEDSLCILTLENIASLDDRFYPSTLSSRVDDPVKCYWAKFTISSEELQEESFLLEVLDPKTSMLDFYYQTNDGTYHSVNLGSHYPFDFRPFKHKNFIFQIPEIGQPVDFLVKIKSENRVPFLFKIRSFKSFSGYALAEYFMLGLFYGTLGIMAIYNLLLFFTVREKFYLYFVLYVLSGIMMSFSEDGLGFQFVWPSYPVFNQLVISYSPLLFMVCFCIYAASFLELKVRMPMVSKTLFWVTIFCVVYYFINLQFISNDWYFPIYLSPFFIIFYATAKSSLKGFKPAQIFLVAFSFVLVGLIITLIRRNVYYAWDNIIFVYILYIAMLIEIVLLSYAQAEKFKFIKDAKEKAQEKSINQLKELNVIKDKVNEEIEQQVIQKTGEIITQNKIIEQQNSDLYQANQKLKTQAEEIARINKLLDKENEELKFNVKELSKARVFAKEVDFLEFKTIFPDDETCYAYLAKLKWENGYACTKCNHTRCSDGKGNFSKRCSKCGYTESATTGTLFHRVHFPILKGFYMLFLVYANNGKITSAELSRILDLRQNTCWKFSKKIKEKRDTGKSRKPNDVEQKGWAALILNS